MARLGRQPLASDAPPPVVEIGFGALDDWVLRRAASVPAFTIAFGLAGAAALTLGALFSGCVRRSGSLCFNGQEAVVALLFFLACFAWLGALVGAFTWIARGLHAIRLTKYRLQYARTLSLVSQAPRTSRSSGDTGRLVAWIERASAGDFGGERLHVRSDFYLAFGSTFAAAGALAVFIGLGMLPRASGAVVSLVGLAAGLLGVLATVSALKLRRLAEQATDAFLSEIRFLETRFLAQLKG